MLALGLHGLIAAILSGPVWHGWAVAALAAAGAALLLNRGSGFSYPALTSSLTLVIGWVLAATGGGLTGPYLVWFYVLAAVYVWLLPSPYASVWPIAVSAAYGLLLPFSAPPSAAAALAHAGLLLATGWLAWGLSRVPQPEAGARQWAPKATAGGEPSGFASADECEIRLFALADQLAGACILLDAEGRIARFSPGAETIFGRSAREAVGQRLDLILCGGLAGIYQQLEAYGDPAEAGLRSGLRQDMSGLRANGTEFPVETQLSPWSFGASPAFALLLREVPDSDRDQAEARRLWHYLHDLRQGAKLLASSANLRRLPANWLRAFVEVHQASLALLYVADRPGTLRLAAHFPDRADGAPLATAGWDQWPEAEGPIGQAVREGAPVIVPDLASDLRCLPFQHTAETLGLATLAAFPLAGPYHTSGAVCIFGGRPGFFDAERIQFFQSCAHLASVAIETVRLQEETIRRLHHLQAMRNIDVAITSSLDMRHVLNILVKEAMTQLHVDAAAVLLLNAGAQTLEYAAGGGFRTEALQHTRLRLGESYAGRAALARQVIHISDLTVNEGAFAASPLLMSEEVVAYFAVPLTTKGQCQGVLEIFHRQPLNPTPEWMEFLNALAGQAAIAIENATLFETLQRANVELSQAYDSTLEGWSRALDLRDKETEGHTQRVAKLTERLARALGGFSESELVQLRRGALLHDIGKMGVPDSILLKPGPLSKAEWEVMRRHPEYAYEMLAPINFLRPTLDIPYCHHEWWDGSGYPRGLRADDIPLPARLFALVDVWDALSSDRPYRRRWPKQAARAYIEAGAGTHFDPEVTDLFLKVVQYEH